MAEKIELTKQNWNPISGIQPPTIIRSFEGVNRLNPFAIKDSHATRNKNFTTSRYPAMAVRDGYSQLGMTLYMGKEVDGLAVYHGKELHAIAGGNWYRWKGGVWETLKTGLREGYKWTFVNFQGNYPTMHLLATNGMDQAMKYDGTNVMPLPNAPALSDFIATHDNRVYIASKNTVYFSALRKAEDWGTVNETGQITVETTDGKEITGIIAGSAKLTVFKANSLHELFGTRPDNYTLKMVAENIGCPTGNAAQVIEGMIYFLGNDGIYRYSGGTLPKNDFSIAVNEYIKGMNKFYADRSISWTDGRKFYLAIPYYSPKPDLMLEFDPIFGTWNVWDMNNMYLSIGNVMLDGKMYGGNVIGEVIEFGGNSDKGNPIPWEWVSKPFSFQSLASKSRWYRLWVVADIPAGATFNIHLSDKDDGEDWTLVQSIQAENDIQAREILIPTNLVNHSNWIRIRLEGTGKVVVHELSRQERMFPMGLT